MKYGAEIINTMAARPTVQFKMADLVKRNFGELQCRKEKKAIPAQMLLVLEKLIENGSVVRICNKPNSCLYQWNL